VLQFCEDYNIDGAIRAAVVNDRSNLSWAVFNRAGEILRANTPNWLAPGLTAEEIAEARATISNMHDAPFAGTVYIRYNALPACGHSTNYATGEAEHGVSCYRAAWDLVAGCYRRSGPGLDGAAFSYLLQGADIFLISGREIGIGADGEPLLHDPSVLAELCFDRDKDGYTVK